MTEKDHLDELLNNARERDMWQDIETAPKDETDILLYRVWSLKTYLPPIVAAWFDNSGGAGWCSHEKPDNFIEGTPTHWQPLPAPPKP